MKALRFALVALSRDWRSGELAVLSGALLIAVAALTAVGFFTSRVSQAVEAQAGEVLAADLRLESAREITGVYREEANRRGLASARVVSLASVVYSGEDSSLAAVRAVDAGYPLRGRIRIANRAYGAERQTQAVPEPGTAWADPRLLGRLGVDVGAELDVGGKRVEVTRSLEYRPDQGWVFINLAPTLLINIADVAATELIRPGSRVTYADLFAGSRGAIRDFRDYLEANKLEGESIEDVRDSSPQISTAIERAQRFLSLSAMVSVLLAAIAVAMAARRYSTRHLDHVALMKCMGARQGFILWVFIAQLGLLALFAGLLGSVIGYFAQQGLALLLADFVKGSLPPPSPGSAWLGLTTATAILIGFALPSWLQLRQVPPARVLSRNFEPPPLRYTVVYGLAILTVIGLLLWLVRDLELALYVLGGAFVTLLVLWLAGTLLVQLLRTLRGGVGVAWRYGLANIVRRSRDSTAQILAFGVGLMVLLLLTVVRQDLLRDWRASLPEDAPNHFLINIQPDEREALIQFLADRDITVPRLSPLVRARLTEINGTPVSEIEFDSDRARGFTRREANLTWRDELQVGNRVVAGEWWDDDDLGEALVSVDLEIAEVLGLKIGDTVTHDVAGESIAARVASFREIQWDTFRSNFFLVFSPGTFDGFPASYITALYLNDEQRPVLLELVRQLPGVTIFDLDAMLSQVRTVMDQASLAVQSVFVFTLIAGLVVLLAAIQATRDERRYESALLRTLGASRQVVQQGVAAEFFVIGLLAGVLASTGASIAGFLLATQLFELEYTLDLWLWAAGLVAGTLIVGVSGTLATRSVVNQPPVMVLRE